MDGMATDDGPYVNRLLCRDALTPSNRREAPHQVQQGEGAQSEMTRQTSITRRLSVGSALEALLATKFSPKRWARRIRRFGRVARPAYPDSRYRLPMFEGEGHES